MKKYLLLFCLLNLALFPSDDDPLEDYTLAIEKFEKGMFAKSQILFQRFIKEHPYEYEVRKTFYYLGRIEIKNKDYLQAISNFNTLQSRYPHSIYRKEALYYLGECYFKLYIRHRAEYNLKEYLKKAKLPNKDIDLKIKAHNYLAALAFEQRQWQLAASRYQKMIRLVDKNKKNMADVSLIQKAYYNMGLLYAERLNNPELAFTYIKEYLHVGGQYSSRIKFALRKIQFSHLGRKQGLPDQNISDIKVDGDDIWISTWGGGVVRYSRSTGKMEKIPLPSNQIRNLYIDYDKVYITSFDGIFIYDKSSSKSYKLATDSEVFALAQKIVKDDRYIYFSTLTRGVVKYDIIRKNIEVLDKQSFIKSNQVYAMAADHNYLIFGTLEHGAVIFDKKTQKVDYLNKENGLFGGNNVKTILIDGRYVWFGIHRFGVYRYDLKLKKTKYFDWKLAYPTIMARFRKEIWVGSSGHGILIFNRETNKVKKLRAIEGLSSNDVSHIRIEGDYAWIGYLGAGIDVMYNPANILEEK